MNRRFNFTGRQRIEQTDIMVTLHAESNGDAATFDAELDLTGLDLPDDAQLMIEASRGASILRFPWGTVGQPIPPSDRRLMDMQNNPSFRIKVLAGDGSGVLLALANHVRPHREEHHGSLVWLDTSDDLGKEVWRLDFGNDDNPTLYLNERVSGIGKAVRNDRAFQSLVFPEVLRAMLTRAISVDGAAFDDDGEKWQPLLLFVRSFHDESLPIRGEDVDGEGDGNQGGVIRWIDDAVKAFTQKNFPASDFYAETLER